MEPQGGGSAEASYFASTTTTTTATAAAAAADVTPNRQQAAQQSERVVPSPQLPSPVISGGDRGNNTSQRQGAALAQLAGHNELDSPLRCANNNNNNYYNNNTSNSNDNDSHNAAQDPGANNNNNRVAGSVRDKDNGGSGASVGSGGGAGGGGARDRSEESVKRAREEDETATSFQLQRQQHQQQTSQLQQKPERQAIVASRGAKVGAGSGPLDGRRGIVAVGVGSGAGESTSTWSSSSSSVANRAAKTTTSATFESSPAPRHSASVNRANNYNSGNHFVVALHQQQQHQKHLKQHHQYQPTTTRPLILITDPNSNSASHKFSVHEEIDEEEEELEREVGNLRARGQPSGAMAPMAGSGRSEESDLCNNNKNNNNNLISEQVAGIAAGENAAVNNNNNEANHGGGDENDEEFEEIDGIRYRIVAAVTKPSSGSRPDNRLSRRATSQSQDNQQQQQDQLNNKKQAKPEGKLNSMRRKSSAFVSNLLHSTFLGPTQSNITNDELGTGNGQQQASNNKIQRRLSIYEMTKSPPPETSLEIYLNERRRSSTVSSKQAQAQITEQKSTFETNYCARQQYFRDLNAKLINQDKKLLNVVANRGQIHRHSVDIAQLPLNLAQAKAGQSSFSTRSSRRLAGSRLNSSVALEAANQAANTASGGVFLGAGSEDSPLASGDKSNNTLATNINHQPIVRRKTDVGIEGNFECRGGFDQLPVHQTNSSSPLPAGASRLEAIRETTTTSGHTTRGSFLFGDRKRSSASSRGHPSDHLRGHRKSKVFVRRFKKLDQSVLSSTPAPDVKIGQRVAYKEYYGNEFGTIRWIGRVPQICPDWTVGVEFDNAIGEGDGSLNGRRYFLAKDCFAKFLPLERVNLVDQHVGRPEPGTMISVMSAAVRPGQMISIQRVSTVHVQHCFLNAPHRKPGADILAVNTRLHCQCPNCGPCAHVIKPPRTERLVGSGKNATHMCQFSTYTCCGMESSEEAMCTYTGNKISSLPPPASLSALGVPPLPPVGNSWIEGAGYLTNLQAQQSKLMPEEYRYGAAPEDVDPMSRRLSTKSSSSRRGSAKHYSNNHGHSQMNNNNNNDTNNVTPRASPIEPTSRPCSCCQQQQQTSLLSIAPTTSSPPPSYTPPDGQFTFPPQTSKIQVTEASNIMSLEPQPPKLVDDDSEDEEGNYARPKGQQKIVYRDSIENRYLFPTDEPVDSTLEADLEDLSQARYGHVSSRTNHSRSLLKSLRSLVSCLSSSNSSEIDRYSERTYRYNGQPASHDINKSLPTMMMSSSMHQEIDQDFPSGTTNSHYCDENKDDPSKQDLQSAASFLMSFATSPDEKDEFPVPPYRGPESSQVAAIAGATSRHISGSSDCGFSSASMNSANISGSSPLGSLADEKRMNQIYKHIVNRLLNSPSITDDDLQRLRRALFFDCTSNQIAQQTGGSCCLHAATTNTTEQVYQNTTSLGCSKNMSTDQIVSELIRKANLSGQGSEWHSEQVGGADPIGVSQSYCTSTTMNQWFYDNQQSFVPSTSDFQQHRHLDHSHSRSSKCSKKPPAAPKSLAGSSSASESITLSSQSESLNTNASEARTEPMRSTATNTRQEDIKSVTLANSGLPKAFELKLTLSINGSEKKELVSEQQPTIMNLSRDQDEARSPNTDQPPEGSTLNINIVSSQPENPQFSSGVLKR